MTAETEPRCEITGMTDARKIREWTLRTAPETALGDATRDELLREVVYLHTKAVKLALAYAKAKGR